MFLKREMPETDDFVVKKYLVMKEKYLLEFSLFQDSVTILFPMIGVIAIALSDFFFYFFLYRNINLTRSKFYPRTYLPMVPQIKEKREEILQGFHLWNYDSIKYKYNYCT